MEVLSKNKIKWIRSLRLKKNRDSEKLFVVEGAKMVQEIIEQWPSMIRCVVTTIDSTFETSNVFETDTTTMKSLSALKTPPTVLAVVDQPEISPKATGLTVVVNGIQDPGNMGTIIRTADWFGIKNVVCSNETVDIFNSKVIQSSMGSLFRVSCEYCDLASFLSNTDLPIYGALMEGKPLSSFKPLAEGILIVGNEGQGISEEIIACITDPIHIPGKGGAESLNVAVAAGILMNHLS